MDGYLYVFEIASILIQRATVIEEMAAT